VVVVGVVVGATVGGGTNTSKIIFKIIYFVKMKICVSVSNDVSRTRKKKTLGAIFSKSRNGEVY